VPTANWFSSSRRRWALVVLCYAGLATISSWPLLRALGSVLPDDLGDPALNTWILWWNAHAPPLTAQWWNAPIFYPAAGAFGLSETMLGVALLTSPLQWIGLSPVEAYNIAFVPGGARAGVPAHTTA
jgi:hypothetical protein